MQFPPVHMSVATETPIADGVRWQNPHAPGRSSSGVGVASEMADFQDVSEEFYLFPTIYPLRVLQEFILG